MPLLSDVFRSVWGLLQAPLCGDTLMIFGIILCFCGVRLVVSDLEPCLVIPLCGFRLKLAIRAVLLSVHQHACHAESIAVLEWSQTLPGGSRAGKGNGVRRVGGGENNHLWHYETYAL